MSSGALQMVPPVGHVSGVVDAALSPDGRWMASLSRDGQIRLWEVATGRTLRVMQHLAPSHEDVKPEASALLFSRDGARLFSGGGDNAVRVWSVATGQLLATWPGPSQRLSLDSSGQKLLGGSKTLRIWDAGSGAVLKNFEGVRDQDGDVVAAQIVQWAADARSFLAVSFQGTISRFDAQTGAILGHFNTRCTPQALSLDGKTLLVTASAAGVVEGGLNLTRNQSALVDCSTGELGPIVSTPKTSEAVVPPDVISGGTFSPDGQWLILGRSDGGVRARELATGREIWPSSGAKRGIVVEDAAPEDRPGAYPSHRDGVESLRFSREGAFLVSGSDDQTARLWSWPDFQEVATFRGYAIAPELLQLSPDGTLLALATNATTAWSSFHLDCSLRIIDVASGHVLRTWNLERPLTALSWDKTGQQAWAASGDGEFTGGDQTYEINGFDLKSGQKSAPLLGHTARINALSVSGDGKHLVSSSFDSSVRVWDLASKRELSRVEADATHVAFAPDGKAADLDLDFRTFDARTGQGAAHAELTPSDLPAQAGDAEIITLIRIGEGQLINSGKQWLQLVDGRSMTAHSTVFMALRDAQSGKLLKSWPLSGIGGSSELSLTPDGKNALIFDPEAATLRLWNIAEGRITRTEKLPDSVSHAALSNDGKLVFTTGTDDVTRFIAAGSGKTLLSYLVMDGGDWLAYTADGRFDGSPGGIEKVYFKGNGQTFSLDQFAERFYQPGLVDLTLRGTGLLPASNAATILAQGAPPLVKITSPQPGAAAGGEIEVSVEARAQNGGGVKAIRLYHNGRLVGGPANLRSMPVAAELQAPATTQAQKFSVSLVPGVNILRAVAYSQTDLESRPDEVDLWLNSPRQAKPKLFLLAVGINAYHDATMNLAYARPDAQAMSDFFETNASAFSGVKITRLMDGAASREAIEGALKQMASDAAPGDVAVIYLAGHGETAAPSLALDRDENAPQTFYFLPADADGMALKEQVRRGGLSGPTIDELVSKIAARKVLLIYDACKSGAAVDDLTRAGAQEQRALGLLARAQGIFVLTASNGQQYANEVRALGHGILTYALLEGLGGKAADVAKTVRVQNLLDYSKDRVPALAQEYRGRQQFPLSYGRGQNFPLSSK